MHKKSRRIKFVYTEAQEKDHAVPPTLGICITDLLKREISYFQSSSNNFVSVYENQDNAKRKK